ncbi:triose-phosphate isomerase [Mycoplasma putrefaciens]|uniref:Triosephosphate isomerase n=1 Tax=Mycoplasma putrefaciens (strain ATCC 15718 / NCTC 10155 / C30 KS-1 / KS-1) TaxID=743965 RepID=A0A7U4E9W4_MYCPK|nr:triose-phosphate isomerase [Mycoplasma putrefaciens]AEM68954.1 triose-phosphate isomerase [Mycoplasma putrefaciens KS1]
MRKTVIFGNWKMNGTNQSIKDFLSITDNKINDKNVVAGLAVPFTLLQIAKQLTKNIKIAAQNVHFQENGAFTGEISPLMLKDLNVDYAIVGHSERREMFCETDQMINQKVKILLKHNIIPIICCGESLEIKQVAKTIDFVNNQIIQALKDVTADQVVKIIIAYEPIWAIGTGKTATAQDAELVCQAIRDNLASIYDQKIADQIIIQYGGSVKPNNIKEYLQMPNIDGALVGGASLQADDYLELINYEQKN